MSATFGKVKGFKNDKRNLIEATNNLVVFGQGQAPPPDLQKGRRGLRHRQGNNNNSLRKPYKNVPSSRSPRKATKSRSMPPAGPIEVETRSSVRTRTKEKDILPKDLMNKYFSNTKPWMKSKKSSGDKVVHGDVASKSSSKRKSIRAVDANHDGMKNIESAIFTNDIVCPICLKGFEPLQMVSNVTGSDIMKHSLAAYQYHSSSGKLLQKTLEDGWGAVTQSKYVMKPQDVVVSANCGELFHKVCLREWCGRTHSNKMPRTQKPVATCPSCGKELKYTVFQEVEVYRNYSSEPTVLDREFNKTKHTHKELQALWPKTCEYLKSIKRDIKDTLTIYSELKSKRRQMKSQLRKLSPEDLSVIMNKVTNIEEVKKAMTKQDKALEFMEQESLQIMRMYLLTLVRKYKSGSAISSEDFMMVPVDEDALSQKIPRSLITQLNAILNDDEALGLLARLIVPRVDDPKDPESKLKLELEILAKCGAEAMVDIDVPPPPPVKTSTYTVLTAKPKPKSNTSTDVVSVRRQGAVLKPHALPVLKVVPKKLEATPSSTSTIISESMLNIVKTCPACKSPAPQGPVFKPPRICKVVEIGDSDIQINSSAEFSMGEQRPPYTPSQIPHIDVLSKTSSMEVRAVSVAPATANSDYSTVEKRVVEDLTQPFGNIEQPIEKRKNVVNPSPASSFGTIKSLKHSTLAQRICDLVQQNSLREERLRSQEPARIFPMPSADSTNFPQSSEDLLRVPSKSAEKMRPYSGGSKKKKGDYSPPKLLNTEAPEPNDNDQSDGNWSTVSESENEIKPSIKKGSKASDSRKLEPVKGITATSSSSSASSGEAFIYTHQNVKDSCELVYKDKGNRKSRGPTTKRSYSDSSVPQKPPSELSIAIMYILDEDEAENSDTEAEQEKQKMDSEKVLEPIYVTAEKASKFSLAAAASSEGEEPYLEASEEFMRSGAESNMEEDSEEEEDDDEEVNEGVVTKEKLAGISSWPRAASRRGGGERSTDFENNVNARSLFRHKFGYKHEQVVSLPMLSRCYGRRPSEPTVFIENEKVIKQRSQIYGRIVPSKYRNTVFNSLN